MSHADLLKQSLPPVSYDPTAPNLTVQLDAVGAALDTTSAWLDVIRAAMVPNAGPMLEDWETAYGTPGSCTPIESLTRQQRLNQVKAKINEGGTFNKAKAIAIAAALGYTIEIVEHRERSFGRARFGERFAGRDWNLVWDIVTTGNTIFSRTFAGARFGERFRTWGNEALECVMRPKGMSGTLVRFIYY